ncbi:MAG TPA: Smr/MutS family protein [Rubricoccaceae bacterium]
MPRLDDDGLAVTLDLHGARVDEAERLARAVVVEAARRGRSTLRVVHGHSTTDTGGGARTIKTTLLGLLDDGAFGPHVVSALRSDGHVLLGLAPAPRPVTGRLRLADFR